MQEFAAGTDVFITFDHMTDDNELEVTDLQYQVLDADGSVLINYMTAPSFDPAATSTVITVLKQFNESADKIDVRQVNINLVTSAGTFKHTIYYKLIGDLTKLTPLVDSYMTFPESVVVRARMSDRLEYFDALPDAVKAVALENSYQAIRKLKFAFTANLERGVDISTYSADQFKSILSADAQTAIKRAQIVEANALVENSPIRDKIRSGIISETIGESSMFFKQSGSVGGKYPGISDETYDVLKPFLFRSATNAQIWRVRRS